MNVRTALLVGSIAAAACDGTTDGTPGALGAHSGVEDVSAAPSTDVVRVALSEWRIDLTADTVDAGQISLQISNDGQVLHSLALEGQGEEWGVDSIQPGDDATIRLDLTPGVYRLRCPHTGEAGSHEDEGMRALLIVR